MAVSVVAALCPAVLFVLYLGGEALALLPPPPSPRTVVIIKNNDVIELIEDCGNLAYSRYILSSSAESFELGIIH